MSASNFPARDEGTIAAEAGAWVARRDRGLTAAEQDAFLQWLREDERHRAAVAKFDRVWDSLDSLAHWQPAHSTTPNPDLLAPVPPAPRRVVRAGFVVAGVAVVLVAALAVFRAERPLEAPDLPAQQSVRVIPGPERQVLPDGSILAANHGSRFEVAFTRAERRLHLRSGEMHVTVTKDPARPFVVEVDGVAVRAVGTAFAVRRGADAIDVLVTEGRVQLETSAGGPRLDFPAVASGKRARIDTTSSTAAAVVTPVSAAEMERELLWQGVRLEFEAMPLAAVVAEFNLRNRQQLAIVDPDVARVRVAGTFRADQVESFARLLEASFGIAVDRTGEGPWSLRRADPRR